MTDNLRIYDTIPFETRVIGGRTFEVIPYAAVLALSPEQLDALFPDGRRVVAEAVRDGALALMQAEAQQMECAS